MYSFFDVLIPFLLIHIVCDFYLQPIQWVDAKKAHTYRAIELYFHALLHGIALLIPAIVLGITLRSTVCLVVIVAVTHFVIDLWKVITPKGEKFSYFLIDQSLHIAVLAVIAFHMSEGLTVSTIIEHEQFSDAVLIIFAYLVVLKPTSIAISSMLSKYTIAPLNPKGNSDIHGLAAGGELIGYLERVLILTFTLLGSYAAVGFVITAKSIFRFGELSKSKDRSMTEYVLIGSLISVVITTLIGTLASLALDVTLK